MSQCGIGQRFRGMTLIELLVTIMILSILGAFSVRAVTQAINGQSMLEAHYAHWQQLARAFGRIESDLLQLGGRQAASSVAEEETRQPAAVWLERTPEGHSRLLFWKMDAQTGAERVGFEFEAGTLYRLSWPGLPGASTLPVRTPLLEGVSRVEWAVLDNAHWYASWPSSPARAAVVPQAVRLDIEQGDAGQLTRLFALR